MTYYLTAEPVGSCSCHGCACDGCDYCRDDDAEVVVLPTPTVPLDPDPWGGAA